MEGEGLVDPKDGVVGGGIDAGEGGGTRSSKRKAGDQLEEERRRNGGGEGKGDEVKVEEGGGGPVVLLTKAGKPRRKKGKAIVACEVSSIDFLPSSLSQVFGTELIFPSLPLGFLSRNAEDSRCE